MSSTNKKEDDSIPEYMRGWKNQSDTLAEFRKLRPSLHKTTLGRMRRQGKVEAMKFAGEWYYKPETAFPSNNNPNSKRIW